MEEFHRLKRSKKAPQTGDIFAFQFVRKPDAYFFGRVIRADVPMGNEKHVLAYFYGEQSLTKDPPKSLPLHSLAVPPVLTGDVFWTKVGYFETVAHRELQPQDVLPQHVFHDFIRNRYLTVDGLVVPKPADEKTVGRYSLLTDVGLEKLLMKPLLGIEHPFTKK